MALIFKDLDFVKVVGVNGDFRFGCVQKVTDNGWVTEISFNDEGLNKINYDTESGGASAQSWSKDLTLIEKSMIPLLALGYSTAQLSEVMRISPITARAYIRLLRIKLGLENRAQVIAFAQGLKQAWGDNNGEGTPGPH